MTDKVIDGDCKFRGEMTLTRTHGMNKRKSTSMRPEEFGRGLLDFDKIGMPVVIDVSQSVIDDVLVGEKRDTVKGLHLVMKVRPISTPSDDTTAHEYILAFADKPGVAVASFVLEEVSFKNDASRTKFFSFAVSKIVKFRGKESSKCTHVLAAAIGDYQGRRLRMLADAMPVGTTLDVKLIYDDEKSKRSITSYWEFESSIEKHLAPYNQDSRGASVKVKSSI